ncbi:hypothetical protein HHK36_027973 [Tetracentron sinense]|uniref:Bifunctional inhibitor/plant lipid transfer protein/seed storage helical domain-containing protein n=1 Tax=Tetracentron sinense TaxID=13715 RepID=A0A835D412_TETSI|nr:hypothetical protein HHK36_027973 [Tetracentron sinense]
MFTCVSSTNGSCIPCTPKSPPMTPSTPKSSAKCPKDTLNLGVCANLLGGLVSSIIGTPPTGPCCALLTGLTDLEAALCLCTAIKGNVLGVIKLDVPIALTLIVNSCGKKIDAHIGGVNDLAFSHPNKQLSVITCGDEKTIKVWDAANGTKQYIFEACPHIRFNKEGKLLAVSANENGIKILANADNLLLLRTFESHSFDASRVVSETVTKPTIGPISAVVATTSSGLADRGAPMVAIAGLMNGETRNLEEANDKSKIWKLTEINEPTQCRSLRLPDNLRTTKPLSTIYCVVCKMAVMGTKVAALTLFLNLILFTCVSSTNGACVPCTPKSPPMTPSTPKKSAKCPMDTLKLGVCANLLGGLVSSSIGTPPTSPCCALLTGLTDLEAALCLCTAIKGNVLGVIKIDIPVALSLIVNSCGKKVPKGFSCS